MGEHLPYKQRVTGSSPVLSTKKDIGTQFSVKHSGLEGETVQSKLPVDVCDRGRPSAQFARESSPVLSTKIVILITSTFFSAPLARSAELRLGSSVG